MAPTLCASKVLLPPPPPLRGAYLHHCLSATLDVLKSISPQEVSWQKSWDLIENLLVAN